MFAPDKRNKRDALRVASVIEKEVVKGRDNSWNSKFKPQVEVSRPSAVDGVEAATSAWVADE